MSWTGFTDTIFKSNNSTRLPLLPLGVGIPAILEVHHETQTYRMCCVSVAMELLYYVSVCFQVAHQHLCLPWVAGLPRNRPWECVVEPGEIIFIPHGWWHMALNTELTIAVTHNFVSPVNLGDVVHFLRTRRDQTCLTTRHVLSTVRSQRSINTSVKLSRADDAETRTESAQHAESRAISSSPVSDATDLYAMFMQGLEEKRPQLYNTIVNSSSCGDCGRYASVGDDSMGSCEQNPHSNQNAITVPATFSRNVGGAIMQQTTHKDKVTPFSFNF